MLTQKESKHVPIDTAGESQIDSRHIHPAFDSSAPDPGPSLDKISSDSNSEFSMNIKKETEAEPDDCFMIDSDSDRHSDNSQISNMNIMNVSSVSQWSQHGNISGGGDNSGFNFPELELLANQPFQPTSQSQVRMFVI